MVRSSRSAPAAEDRARAGERLAALRLGPAPGGSVPGGSVSGGSVSGGWVPEPPADGLDPAPAVRDVAAEARASAALAAPGVPPLGELARAWVIDRSPPWAHGLLARVGGRAVAAVLAGVLVLVVGVMVVRHRSAGSADPFNQPVAGASIPSGQPSDPAPAATDDGSSIVVDVGGRVRKPGLVTLPAGARVADAIAAAGGPLRHREVATIDLAARVSDGQLLLIGVKGGQDGSDSSSDSGGVSGTGGSPAPVGLNSATIDQLETLPGVGPVTAQKIIDWRSAHNGFTSVAQLQQVPGIGPARYAELSPLVTP